LVGRGMGAHSYAIMDPIAALCERYGLPLIEDAAESLGAK